MSTPHRTTPQRMEALQRANQVRVARKALKALIKSDRDLDVARQIISNPDRAALEVGHELAPTLGYNPPPGWLDTMAVIDVLLACRSIGASKAAKIMREAWGRLTPINTRRIGGMTPQHRLTLAAELERQARRLDYRSPNHHHRQEDAA